MGLPVLGESDPECTEAGAFERDLLVVRGVKDSLAALARCSAASATANARSIFRRILSATARRGRRV